MSAVPDVRPTHTAGARAGRCAGLLPREHGAWLMVYVPALCGVVVGGRPFEAATWWCLFALTSLFFAQDAAGMLCRRRDTPEARRWLGVCSAAFLASAVGLLASGRWILGIFLVPAGTLFFYQATRVWRIRRRFDRKLGIELATAAVLVLSAPATVLAARPNAWLSASVTWAAFALFLGGSVCRVKVAVTTLTGVRYGFAKRAVTAFAGTLVLGVVAAWMLLDAAPAGAATTAAAPAVLYSAGWGPSPGSMRRVGLQEAFLTSWFGLWAAAAFRMAV